MNNIYLVTVSYDGKSAHWEKQFPNFGDAVKCYEGFTDWGFADEFSTVTLRVPFGELSSKTFRRPN
jgi:hypothetical protein